MANQEYITRTDLETIIQRVRIENQEQEVKVANASEITRPLIEEEKKKSLKEIEDKLEERSVFQNIGDGISSLNKSILNGFSGLTDSLKEKGKSALSVLGNLAGIIAGLIITPLIALGGFFGQLATEVAFLNKITKGKLGLNALSGFLSKIANVFNSITKISKGKGFLRIVKFAGSIGRILGKVFLPITILFAIFDFVKGFMKGYKEDGIIGGITEGIIAVFDGLVGGLLRLLAWIPQKIFELLGLDNLAAAVMPALEGTLNAVKNAFRGLVDVVVGIFTLDGEKIKNGFGQYLDAMISSMTMPFKLLNAFVQDIFGIEDPFAMIKDSIASVWKMITQSFERLKEAVPKFLAESISKIPGGKQILKSLNLFKDQPSRVVKRAPRQLGTNYMSLGGMAPPQRSQSISANTQTNTNVSNNVSYNIQGNTNLASDALNFATGSSTGFYAPR